LRFAAKAGMPMEKSLSTPLSVAIVEDEDDTRAWLAASVVAHPELHLAAEYASGREALAGLAQSAPDVLLVDLGLQDMSGLEVIGFVAARHPECNILVVSIFGDEEHVLPALEAGARGFLLKGTLTRDITLDIRELSNGGSPLSPIIARQVLKRLRPASAAAAGEDEKDVLTSREVEILRTIARGFSYAETAELLGISVQTVHTHLKRIYRKLAVHSKTEAVFEADQRNLI
jgi:DNA-binding NarL/FixJ family response regulator